MWAIIVILSFQTHCVHFSVPADGYRPVIIMHGIFSSYEGMDDLVALIKAAHPGTDVYNIDAYNDAVSI